MACTELVAEHQRMVFHLALHLLGDHDEALDLSQEVFLNVFRTIGRFRGQSALRTWIYRIVINQARNRQRWWRRRHRAEQVSLDERIEIERRSAAGERPGRAATGCSGRRSWRPASGTRWRRLPFDQRTVDRAAGDRRFELRRNRVFAGRGGRHREVAADPGARGAAQPAERGGQVMMARGVSASCGASCPRSTTASCRSANRSRVQAHLRECPACAAETRELDELGSCLRDRRVGDGSVQPRGRWRACRRRSSAG